MSMPLPRQPNRQSETGVLPLAKNTIRIAIADDSTTPQCQARCGTDWSSPAAISLAYEQIKEKFGDRLTLEYLDMAQPTTNHYTLELKQQVRDRNLLLPLLMINGRHRISGQFDIRMLVDAIEAEIEIQEA